MIKNTEDKMKHRNFIDSLNDALSGIIECLVHERNIKIDFIAAILAILLSILIGFNGLEIVIICIMIGLVISAEMMNTAIENLCDLVTLERNPKVKKIKDTAAGAVLVLAVTAVIVWYGLAFDKIDPLLRGTLDVLTNLPLHISIGTLLVVTLAVIFIKALTQKGTYLRGGMPSGHAAIAATAVMIIWYLTQNTVVLIVTIILAMLVVHSRVEARIHTFTESILGILTGTVISLVIFGLLKYFGLM